MDEVEPAASTWASNIVLVQRKTDRFGFVLTT